MSYIPVVPITTTDLSNKNTCTNSVREHEWVETGRIHCIKIDWSKSLVPCAYQVYQRYRLGGRVVGRLSLKSSRPLSQLGPGSTRPGVFSEHSATYMIYGLFCIIMDED